MKNSYDIYDLEYDMDNMAYMFEFCIRFVRRLYRYTIDRNKFLTAFMHSKCREAMEKGNPRLINQAAIDTVQDYVHVDLNDDISIFKATANTNNKCPEDIYFWTGQTYAALHYYYDVKSKDLIEVYPIKQALSDFWWGHEVGLGKYLEKSYVFFTDEFNKRGIEYNYIGPKPPVQSF